MLISMTGSARKTVSTSGGEFTFILNSFNHSYLQINLNLPEELKNWEVDAKNLIKKKVRRGSIDLYIDWRKAEKEEPLQINFALLKKYYSSLKQVKEKLDIKGEIDLSLLLSFSQFFVYKKETANSNLWSLVGKNINLTLAELIKVRKEEGEELQADINTRINKILDIAAKIKFSLPQVLENYRKKIEGKLLPSSLPLSLKEKGANEEEIKERIRQEVAVQTTRIDVSEEITRLRAHGKMFRREMQKKASSGKRLDFISQEMLREANTLTSKVPDAKISSKVVDLKVELSKIREQLRNVE